MTTCPQCGTKFSANERLCPHDGSVLEPDQPTELKHIGKVLDNKYRLDSYLSRGGMGAVYRATHVMLGRPVAVKLINPDLVTSPDIVRRFQREARAVTHLNHPNIVEVYDLGQTPDGTLYIAMELVSGESLSSLIKSTGALPPSRIVSIMGQVVSALGLAHRKEIVHRDLKPHNIMITRGEDGQEVAKLLDFGIAKTFEFDANTQLTATGTTIGTPQYMSPEQAMGMAVDARSDLYSLGIILYEMLVGEVPFNDPSMPAVLVKHMNELPVPPSQRRPDLQISSALEAITLRLLEKDPARRFQTAGELGVELQGVPIEEEVDFDPTRPIRVPVVAPTQTFKPTVLDPNAATAATAAPGQATMRQPAASVPTFRPPPPLPPPVQPGTRPTAAVAPPPLPPPVMQQPIQPRNRSMLVPIAVLVLLAVVGGAYWVMTQPAAGDSVTASPAPAATPAGAESPRPEPPPTVAAASPPATSSIEPSPATREATAPPSREAATPPASPPPARSATESAKPPAADTRPTPTPAPAVQAPPPAPAQPAANPIPATPSVSFECTGPSEVCGPLRQAILQNAEREGFVMTRGSNKAVEFVVTAEVAIVDERQQTQFGTNFVVRTYSIDISAESTRFDQDVPMPATKTFTADTGVGRERLAENARVAAADAIERVQQFWKKRVP
jgi:serine/threonine protein kinase